jgi:ubiquinone/menaquinone biosynthesis C-methylase UbiE
MSDDSIKAQVSARFSQFAADYVSSPTHRQGQDLDRLLEIAAPQPGWLALDVATGGGHTALKIAPHVRAVAASDLSISMLTEARNFIRAQGARNVVYTCADAERLPFADSAFDLVTCRAAAHHFPDAFKFVQEAARVLKSGGRLVIQDHLLPDDEAAADYIEAFETLRDPSHQRAFNEAEWRGMFLDADLVIDHVERLTRPTKMIPWAERQGCTPDIIERLHVLMLQAPETVKAWMGIVCAGSDDAGFDHVYILIAGHKK